MMKTKILMLIILSLMFYNCENIIIEESNDPIQKIATLIWNGEYEVDGCGFTIEITNEIYKPENEDKISDGFKKNNRTSVLIKYLDLKKEIEYYCGDTKVKDKGLKIISVIPI